MKPDYIDDLLELAEKRLAQPKRQVTRDRSPKGVNSPFPWSLVLVAIAVILGLAIVAMLISRFQ